MLKWNDIIDTIREKKISGKVITMAAGTSRPDRTCGNPTEYPYKLHCRRQRIAHLLCGNSGTQNSSDFDAAWGNEDTQKIMEILKKHNVKVTFFMTGGWVEHYPDDVKMILAEGHDLGNHSENHKNMSQLADSEKETELMKVHEKVKNLTGYEMFLFRPPYGDYDNAVVKTAKKCGYYTIQWDVDSLDWKDYGVDSIIKTVTEHKHLGNGSIILCHNGAKFTADALDTLITTLQDKGYTFVPLSQPDLPYNYR